MRTIDERLAARRFRYPGSPAEIDLLAMKGVFRIRHGRPDQGSSPAGFLAGARVMVRNGGAAAPWVGTRAALVDRIATALRDVWLPERRNPLFLVLPKLLIPLCFSCVRVGMSRKLVNLGHGWTSSYRMPWSRGGPGGIPRIHTANVGGADFLHPVVSSSKSTRTVSCKPLLGRAIKRRTISRRSRADGLNSYHRTS